MATLTVPVTNIGFELLLGDYDAQPTESIGDIKSADGIEYQVQTVTYAPVNKGGYTLSVPTMKAGQAVSIEIYMNDSYQDLIDRFHDNDVSSEDFYCALAFTYPKNSVNAGVNDYYYNGFISKLKSSGGSEAEAQYFSFEFTPVGAPIVFTEEEDTVTE